MMIKGAKLNGNGNDFIAIDNMELRYDTEQLRDFAIKLCRRKECVGGDGILVTEPSLTLDFKMRIFNSDGSEGEMCGNGARCLARYAFENKIVEKNEMVFETLSGDVSASVSGDMALLNLSPVNLERARIGESASVDGFDFQYTFITVGVPHTVIFQAQRDRSDDEYKRIGRSVRYMAGLFPEGTNVNFVFPLEAENELYALTYERGVEDLTLSCGTGSTAAAISAHMAGRVGKDVKVWNPGGLNRVIFDFTSDGLVLPKLEGAVKYVAELSFRADALN